MSPLKQGPIAEFPSADAWNDWLGAHHASAKELWLRFARKGAARTTVTRAEALEAALCWGWIDGQARSESDEYWLQRFTPRTRRSKWSQINRDAAEALIATGKMKPAGLAAVESAKADGRWDAAYAAPRNMVVPEDLARELEQRPEAKDRFNRLDAQDRYSILYRIQDAKKPETRARRIAKYVEMMDRGETIH